MQIPSQNIFFNPGPFLVPHFFQNKNLEGAKIEKEKFQSNEGKFKNNESKYEEYAPFGFSHPHQIVFTKNLELLKSKYQRLMSPNLEWDLWKNLYISVGQASFFEKMSVCSLI